MFRNICKTCFIQIRDHRQVRQHLTDAAAVLAANALVSSRLDYCNSLFRSLSSFHMCKLQFIQNTLQRIVINCNRYSRASPILKKLHCLPVEFRCIFKTVIFVYKFLHSGLPWQRLSAIEVWNRIESHVHQIIVFLCNSFYTSLGIHEKSKHFMLHTYVILPQIVKWL